MRIRIKGVIRFKAFEIACIEQAIQYIDHRFRDHISAEHLSLEVGLDIRKLRAGIKTKTKLTLRDYILKVRVEKSKALLVETNYPLKQIAGMVGFKTESHFGKKFKDLESITPQEFRYRSGQKRLKIGK